MLYDSTIYSDYPMTDTLRVGDFVPVQEAVETDCPVTKPRYSLLLKANTTRNTILVFPTKDVHDVFCCTLYCLICRYFRLSSIITECLDLIEKAFAEVIDNDYSVFVIQNFKSL